MLVNHAVAAIAEHQHWALKSTAEMFSCVQAVAGIGEGGDIHKTNSSEAAPVAQPCRPLACSIALLTNHRHSVSKELIRPMTKCKWVLAATLNVWATWTATLMRSGRWRVRRVLNVLVGGIEPSAACDAKECQKKYAACDANALSFCDTFGECKVHARRFLLILTSCSASAADKCCGDGDVAT